MSQKDSADLELKKTEELEEASLLDRIAVLRLRSDSQYKICQALGITRQVLRQHLASEEYRQRFQEIHDRGVSEQLKSWRFRLRDLDGLAYAALKKNLEEGKLEAVKTYHSIMAGQSEDPADEKVKGSTLQVFMPGAAPENTQKPIIDVSVMKKEP